MEAKIKVKLGRVQETLLLPLISRAKETEYKKPLLNDTKAVELFDQLDVDRKKLLKNICKINSKLMFIWMPEAEEFG